MPRAKRDLKTSSAIFKAFTAGANLSELKQKFGIRGKAQLMSAIFEAQVASGKLPALARGRGRAKKVVPAEFSVSVNKRGTIVIPKEAVIDSFRLKEGQSLTARKRGKKVILTSAG